jgi:hypothetical protein
VFFKYLHGADCLEYLMATQVITPHLTSLPPSGSSSSGLPILLNSAQLSLYLFGIMIFFGSIVIIEPSPYDVFSLAAIPFFLLTGFKIKRGLLFFIIIMTLYEIGGFTALIPHFYLFTFILRAYFLPFSFQIAHLRG